jgi:uncharacterized protein DUF4442
MDFELMRAGLEQAVPLNQHLGLQVAELSIGRGVVVLPDDGPLAESAEITYKKIPRGRITATAVLGATPEELFAELESDGSVRFTIDVALTDDAGDVVADMAVRWTVRQED